MSGVRPVRKARTKPEPRSRLVKKNATSVARDGDLQVKNQAAWATWLDRHHDRSTGVWLVLAKKGSGLATPTYQEAVEVALCFGWIDGQGGARDAATWAQRFTPRGRRSMWSKINVDRAEALIAAGKMRPAGVAAVEAAKKDGRWEAAYESQRVARVPDDLAAALDANPTAKAFFATLSSVNRYAILFRVQTVKRPETRKKRIAHFVAMLERHETVHP
jgi:uncharacterized protein YdeI (YjbR/CyaY-like superfamily)